MTATESSLWDALRGRRFRGLKFRRQARIGHCIADFYCAEHRSVVEVDRGVHATQNAHDAQRQNLLEEMGLRVLRIESSTVASNLETILTHIADACPNGPSPLQRERGGRQAGVRELSKEPY